ncbi:MAG: hypothetical protein LBU39_08515 [Desulfobulbaceae bacterium]|jgi:lysozyme family protein|nr:hypothetical protein [Desulfobulbaceae bacterium]
MSFETAYALVACFEGGYVNNPQDPGGETYAGISRVHHPDWDGWAEIDRAKPFTAFPLALRLALEAPVQAFYRREYWQALRCPAIEAMATAGRDIACELFEASVNCGKKNGVKFLQRAVNRLSGKSRPALVCDGVIGDRTLAALKDCLERPGYTTLLLRCMNGEQYIHYVSWPGHQEFPGVFARTGGAL